MSKRSRSTNPTGTTRIETLLKKVNVEYGDKTKTGGSKLDFLRRFKNTKNPSKNIKRKKHKA